MDGYKLEMHLHTSRNSDCGKECPADIAKIYADAGYNGIVCTNHLNRNDLYGYVAPPWKRLFRSIPDCWLRDLLELKEECAKAGIEARPMSATAQNPTILFIIPILNKIQ